MAIYTGADIQQDKTLQCDVCIVGSGAGGAVTAQRLAEAGKKVIVLEDGGFHTSDTFDMVEKNMTMRLYQEAGGRCTSDRSLSIMQGRAVGGTTVINWTTCFHTPDWVLQHWAEHHGGAVTSDALAPHFARIEERLNVQQMQLSQVNRNNRVLWDGCKELGYEVELLRRNVTRCAHTGYCGMGCPIDAKQSMLVTFLPDAVKLGVEIFANAYVERIEKDGKKAVRAVARIRDPHTDIPTGTTLTVDAKRFVLSAGGINTPALLLRSGLDGNGRVGKRTYFHPTVIVAGIHDDLIEGYRGSPQYVACHEFEHRENGRMGYMLESAPVFPMTAATTNFMCGNALDTRMTDLPHLSASIALLHDGFDLADSDEGGTISIYDDGSPKIDYKWNPRMQEALRDSAKKLMAVQFAGGAERVSLSHAKRVEYTSPQQIDGLDQVVFEPGHVGAYSAHVMGGCAMGKDPKTSVVDAETLRYHGLDNLHIVDGSVLPTAATVNPQITIYGLASWAADHLRTT